MSPTLFLRAKIRPAPTQIAKQKATMAMASPALVHVVNIAGYTAAETTELVSRAGVKRGNMRPDKVFMSAVSAGCMVSFACAVSLSTITAPWFQENGKFFIRLATPCSLAACLASWSPTCLQDDPRTLKPYDLRGR